MIGTKGATVLFAVNVLFASILGVGAGALACLLLRQDWRLKTALIDGAFAAVVTIVAAFAVTAIDASRGVWESRVMLVLAVSVVSVVGRHILRPLLHSSSR